MKCPNCGAELADGAKFCGTCGKSVVVSTAENTIGNAINTGNSVAQDAASTAQNAADAAQNTFTAPAQPYQAPAQQPYQAPASSPVPGVPEKPKKSKAGLFVGIAIVAIIVAAVVCVIMFLKGGNKNPKDAVVDGFKSVFSDNTVKPFEEIFGFDDLNKLLQENPAEYGMALSLENSSDDTLKQFSGAGFSFDIRGDNKNMLVDMDLGIQYANADLTSFKIYVDDTNMMLYAPDFTDKVFTLNYADDLEGQVEDSPFLGQLLVQQGIDLSGYSDYMDMAKTMGEKSGDWFNIPELWKRYKEGSKAIDDLKAAMEVKKTDKKSYTVDGKEEKCQGYEVMIPKDAMVEFIKVTSQFMLDDKTMKDDFNSYIDLMNQAYEMYGLYTEIPSQEDLWSQAQDMVDQVVDSLDESLSDLNMTVYVTKGGKLAFVDGQTECTIDGETITLDVLANITGGYYHTQNYELTIVATSSEESDPINVTITRAGKYDKKGQLTADYTVGLESGEEAMQFTYTGSYTVDSGDFHVAFLGDVTGQTFELNATGVVEDLEKGKSINITADSLAMDINDGEETVELSGSMYVKPLKGSIDPIDGDEMDILAATEEEWYDVVMEMQDAINNLMSKLQ